MPFPFFPVLPLFLMSFSDDTFFGANSALSSAVQEVCHMSTAETEVCSLWQGSRLRLARISTAVFTQQHAVNMCLNEARTKRLGCYHFSSETAPLLKLKCFTLL